MLYHQATKSQVLLSPTTAVSTSRSASFDWSGADYAVLRIITSPAGTYSGAAISVLEADVAPTSATNFATIVADLTSQSTVSHEAVYMIDLKTRKRYGKIILTPGTNAQDAVATTAHLTLSRQEQMPSNTTAMVNTTNDVVTLV